MIGILLRGAAKCLIGLLIVVASVRAAVITTVEFAGMFAASDIPGIVVTPPDDIPSFNGSFTFEDGALKSAKLAIPPIFPDSNTPDPIIPTASHFEVDVDNLVLIEVMATVPWPLGGNLIGWTVEPGRDEFSFLLFQQGGDCPAVGEQRCQANGALTSFEVRQSQSVPEPASLPLLIAALGVGFWFTSRRRPQRI